MLCPANSASTPHSLLVLDELHEDAAVLEELVEETEARIEHLSDLVE